MSATLQKAKGPASAPTLPDHGSTKPLETSMNGSDRTTAPAGPAIPPSANDYAQAFYGLEDRIAKVLRHAKVAGYLIGVLTDRMSERANVGDKYLIDLAYSAASEVFDEVDDLDSAFLATHNDLVRRENAAGMAA